MKWFCNSPNFLHAKFSRITGSKLILAHNSTRKPDLSKAMVLLEEPKEQGTGKALRDLKLLQAVYEDDYSSAMYTYDDLVLTCHYDKERCDRSSWTVRVEVPKICQVTPDMTAPSCWIALLARLKHRTTVNTKKYRIFGSVMYWVPPQKSWQHSKWHNFCWRWSSN